MKTNNAIQKLVLVTLTMIGTLTQIGCSGAGLGAMGACDTSPRNGIYTTTIHDDVFSGDLEVTGNFQEWCDDSSMLQTVYLSLESQENYNITWDTYGSNYTVSEKAQVFAQNLANYDPETQYSLSIYCNEIEISNSNLPQNLECTIKVGISNSASIIYQNQFLMQME